MIRRILIFVSCILLSWPCVVFAAANVYYSVCPFGTGDIKTGSPTITISSGVATLSVGQTGNIGQGCRITYNTSSVCYISGVTDSTHFSVVTATGGTPSNVSGQTVNSIAHEYASLSAAEAGASDASHINNTSLVAADVVLNLACYYDHDDYTADTTACTVDGYTTDATRYINIYTPRGLTGYNESINNQRHAGVWDSKKAVLQVAGTCITATQNLCRLTGLQIKATGNFGNGISFPAVTILIDACIISASKSTGSGNAPILNEWGQSCTATIRNCVVVEGTTGYECGSIVLYSGTMSVINCTITNAADRGLSRYGGTMTVTNCAVFNNTDDFYGTMTVTYTASDDNDVSGTGNKAIGTWSDIFTDYAAGDFSLKNFTGTGCLINAGTTISGMTAVDIIGTSRPQGSSWDIGAFEYVAAGGNKWNTITPSKWNGVNWADMDWNK